MAVRLDFGPSVAFVRSDHFGSTKKAGCSSTR